jgi:hypothetical protein
MILATHSDIATVGETSGLTFKVSDVNAYHCSCGAPILKCEFWKSIEENMQESCPGFSIGDFGSNYRMPESAIIDWLLRKQYHGGLFETALWGLLAVSREWRQKRKSIDQSNISLINAVLSISGKNVFLDSSKNPERLRWLAHLDIPTKYVHLIRDGRGVSLSYQRTCLDFNKAVNAWRKTMNYCEAFLADQPKDSWISMRYEDFCAAPLNELNRILRFCGIPEMNQIGSFRNADSHVVGNAMRLKSGSEIRLDERWRTSLSKQDLATFGEIAGDLNKKYGYQ